jgi:hypothetical protein
MSIHDRFHDGWECDELPLDLPLPVALLPPRRRSPWRAVTLALLLAGAALLVTEAAESPNLVAAGD